MDTIDHILTEYVGGHGPYQWKLLAAVYPVGFASGYPLLLHMMSTYAPPHRCYVEECESLDGSVHADWTSYALPKQTVLKEIVSGGEKFDQCKRYLTIDPQGGCLEENFANEENATVWSLSSDKSTKLFSQLCLENVFLDKNDRNIE